MRKYITGQQDDPGFVRKPDSYKNDYEFFFM